MSYSPGFAQFLVHRGRRDSFDQPRRQPRDPPEHRGAAGCDDGLVLANAAYDRGGDGVGGERPPGRARQIAPRADVAGDDAVSTSGVEELGLDRSRAYDRDANAVP